MIAYKGHMSDGLRVTGSDNSNRFWIAEGSTITHAYVQSNVFPVTPPFTVTKSGYYEPLAKGNKVTISGPYETTIAHPLDGLCPPPQWSQESDEIVDAVLDERPVTYTLPGPVTVKAVEESIAEEAHRLVHGPRRNSYGHPADDYARTIGAFNALTGRDLTIGDGLLFMQLVKLSRQRHTPKRDNLVDLAGYALCEQMTVDADRWNEVP